MHARAFLLCRVVVVLLLGGGALACAPRPSTDDAGSSGPRSAPIDFLRFVHDRPAVGGDWYLYDEDGGHIIEPLPQVYLLREGSGAGARYAAMRISSYYDPNTADSGRFTIVYRLLDDGWNAEQEWLTPKNVKEDGALCLDLFAKLERDCASELWQVQLRAARWLALEGPIVVARPSLHIRSAHGLGAAGDVNIATVDQDSLTMLPNPVTLPTLDDGPQSSWTETDWDRAAYAPDLPEVGMAIGGRFVGDDFSAKEDVWFLLNARRSLVRFVIEPVSDGDPDAGLTITWSKVSVDISDDTVPLDLPASSETSVAVPGAESRAFLSFEADDLSVAFDGSLSSVPEENGWDLSLVRADDGVLRMRVSPGAAVYNASERDGASNFDDAALPERTSP